MPTHHAKDDYLENGQPVHRLSYCAFLDVLGFSARIRASYKDKTANKLLRQFHAIFERRINRLKSEVDESLLYFKSFSDNVLLAHPRFSHDMESEFGFILWSISEYQFEMALQGFFIRGGLSVGNLFVDDNSVYGEALIDAYELESKVAVNPIVVLCDNTMKFVDHHIGYYYGESSPQVRHVLVNADGRYFINYLSECILETDDGEELHADSLHKHKEQIELALSLYADQAAVFAKFSWLSAYHNYFCESVSSYPGYSDALKIDSELATVKFKTLVKK
ncbi:hypothetical protein ACLSSQ_10595 [Azospira sp. APE16]|uniref:hypothetical protein n=1 Tax=Azospira sp. APE16 TaxID=3394231 RepID=UPI003A4E5B83